MSKILINVLNRQSADECSMEGMFTNVKRLFIKKHEIRGGRGTEEINASDSEIVEILNTKLTDVEWVNEFISGDIVSLVESHNVVVSGKLVMPQQALDAAIKLVETTTKRQESLIVRFQKDLERTLADITSKAAMMYNRGDNVQLIETTLAKYAKSKLRAPSLNNEKDVERLFNGSSTRVNGPLPILKVDDVVNSANLCLRAIGIVDDVYSNYKLGMEIDDCDLGGILDDGDNAITDIFYYQSVHIQQIEDQYLSALLNLQEVVKTTLVWLFKQTKLIKR